MIIVGIARLLDEITSVREITLLNGRIWDLINCRNSNTMKIGGEQMDKLTFNQAMREKRKLSKMTQVELAKKTGMSRTYLADLEGGRYEPGIENALKIARVLKINLNILL